LKKMATFSKKPLDKLQNLCYNIITVKIKLKSVERKHIMTKREFLNAVIAETTNSDLASFAVSELEKLDARNAKRASAPSKKSLENAPLIAKIAESLTSEPKLASEVASELEISTQKASALLRQIENVSVCDVKVKGKGTQKGYFFAE